MKQFTCTEAALTLELSPSYVSFLCKTHRLVNAKKINGCWRISDDDIFQLLHTKVHTVKAVATHHCVHAETVRRWLRQGRILGVKREQGAEWFVIDPLTIPAKRRFRNAPAQQTAYLTR